MPNCVDPPVDAVKGPSLCAFGSYLPRNPLIAQLIEGDNPALASG
jgi:hypothetical protein